MGLLTNPNSSATMLIKALAKHSQKGAWLAFILGFAGIFVFPHPEFSHRTYFSENALLPGLVRGEFDEDVSIYRYMDDLKDEAEKYPNNIPFPWLEAAFRQLGLEVYTQDFTVQYPLSEGNATGQNLYAILRAPRASSTEALVLSAPYRPPSSFEQGTRASIAVLLASAKFFRRQYYWAKDIIFLITQHEQLGAQAWLEAYYQESCGSGVLDHGDLEARAGSIQAAINLEINDPKITHFNVKIEGLNGQLPNLDLVNLVNRLCQREGIGQLFQGIEDHSRPESWRGYQRSLKTLLFMMMKQATGIPSGNHGLFHRFGIEALTIEGVYKRKRNRYEADMLTIGRVVEGIFRSLNNLLERFHQSFFFYLLPSASRYVSIGMYMPAFGLIGGALVLAGLGLWFRALEDDNKKSRPEQETPPKKKNELNKKIVTKTDDKGSDPDEEDEIVALPLVFPSSVTSALPIWIMAHLFGLMAFYLPAFVTKPGKSYFQLETEDAVGLGMLAFCVCILIPPKSLRQAAKVTVENWKIVKCITLMELSIIAFSMALCNFSLALLASLIYVPVAMAMSPSRSRLIWLFKLLLCVLSHPAVLTFIISSVDNFIYTDVFNLNNFVNAAKSALMYSIIDGHIYSNISYALASLCLLPNWYLLWNLNFVAQ